MNKFVSESRPMDECLYAVGYWKVEDGDLCLVSCSSETCMYN
jgi:hypothetical protein